jgi:hypothetical protein
MPLVDNVGKSGAGLERVVLADGRRFVVKRVDPKSDLMMALVHDHLGREYSMWADGLLDELPSGVGHAVVDGWVDAGTTVLVMRDLGDAVLTWEDRLSRQRCREILGAVAQLHRHFLGRAPEGLTALTDVVGLFGPTRVEPFREWPNPLPALVLRGWEIFADEVEDDVASPVLDLLADPSPLVDALQRRPVTFVHGDLATVNVALEPGQVTLLDWGMATAAPGAIDLARFVAGCASVVDASREDIIADFVELSGPAHDDDALHLALLSGFAWLGWNKALDAHEHPDLEVRARERDDLAWWAGRSRTTLERGLLG